MALTKDNFFQEERCMFCRIAVGCRTGMVVAEAEIEAVTVLLPREECEEVFEEC